jgi:hypothetical protein
MIVGEAHPTLTPHQAHTLFVFDSIAVEKGA